MMLPANRDDRVLHVHRSLDVDEDALLDSITAFAVKQDLELDRRHDGEGLVFRRAKESTPAAKHLFKKGDLLQVVITEHRDGHDIDFTADLRGSLRRKSDDRRSTTIRSGALAALFAYLGVRGVVGPGSELGIVDFVFFGLSARFGYRAARTAQSADEDLDELHTKVANALSQVCDEAEFGPEPDTDDD